LPRRAIFEMWPNVVAGLSAIARLAHSDRSVWSGFCKSYWFALMLGFAGVGWNPIAGQTTADRVDQFLEAARERGFFDAAEYYLEKLAAAPDVSAALKAEIPFRRAQLLFEKTRTLNNVNELKQAWAEAVEIANEQLANSPDLNRKLQAIQLITQIQIGLAEYQRRQAKLPWERLAESPVHAEEARKELTKAVDAFAKGADLLLNELREARRSTDAARRATFDDNTHRFLNYLVSKMLNQDRVALTYPKSSPEFQQLMEKLVAENTEYANKYKNPPPYDMYFQMYRVRALLHLDKWQEAAPVIDDILLLEASYYRPLKREVVLLGYDVWFREPPFKIELALAQLEKIATELTEADMASDLAQRIKLALAKAHHQRTIFTEALEVPTPEQRTAANISARQRGEIVRQLSKLNSPVADEARELLKEWGMRGPAENVKEVSTFGEAKQAGLDALLQAIELQSQLGKLSPDDAELPENQAIRDEMLSQANQALDWLDRSLELVTSETRRVDLNMTRLYQCQAYWVKGYYLETALIGQFLLDRFPNELGTAEAAAIAAQGLNRLVLSRRATGAEVDVEQRQMVHICQQVLKRWPERKETGDLAFMLITTELDRKNFAAAQDVLAQLSSDNPRRPMAELRMGIAALQEAEAIGRIEGVTPDQLQQRDGLRRQAQEWLTSALKVAGAELTTLHFVGAAALAQVLNDQQQYADTLQLLEQPPLTGVVRIEQNDPLVADVNVQTNMIQSAVIAHMGRLSEVGDVAVATDRVAALLALLQQKLQGHPRSVQILQSYYSLTLRKLREQAAGNLTDQARQNLTNATVKIFDPIIGPSDDWRLVSILGETLLDMAESLPASQQALRTQTLEAAARCYDQSLKLTAPQAQEPDIANFRLMFQVKSAAALRGQGKFDPASKQLTTLLKANPKNPLIQIEMAELYQQWGIAAKDRAHLRTALAGQGKGTDAEMWGWQKLAQATISDAKNRNTFYQALFGMVTCRYQFGKLAGDEKYIDAALKAVKDQFERDKTLGGPEWSGKFDRLVKEIQQHAKRTANGIQGL
jgi:hypothetical protein